MREAFVLMTNPEKSFAGDSFDAVVIGAGPAGSAAAYHLATRGRYVLLVDKREFPRDKACGDGITPEAVDLIAEMGIDLRRLGCQEVTGVIVSGDSDVRWKTAYSQRHRVG